MGMSRASSPLLAPSVKYDYLAISSNYVSCHLTGGIPTTWKKKIPKWILLNMDMICHSCGIPVIKKKILFQSEFYLILNMICHACGIPTPPWKRLHKK